jgi:ADP-heptose:LPS heptosyltransferase
MDWIPKKSPLKNGLFVRRPLSNAVLSIANFLCPRRERGGPIPKNPKKILLCNIANFGDVVISTTVLPVLKKHYPNCEIGFLTGSAAGKAVLQHHPLVSKIHCFDHWYIHRGQGECKAALHSFWGPRKPLRFPGLCIAALHHKMTSGQAVKEIHGYDIAIDLYPYFPNAIPLLAKAEIPIRIGYTTGGFSNLLTHPIEWHFHDRYVGFAHLHLLETLGIDTKGESPLPCYNYKRRQRDHVVVHMGSSSPLKEWDINRWIELIRRCEAAGWNICLTGKGLREQELCTQVAAATAAKNLCDQLDWADFVSTIQEARLLIAVDSAAVHIAAAASTPTIVLYAGMNSPHMWLPPNCKGVMQRVPCAPCFNKKGCASMACIREIGVEEVLKQAKAVDFQSLLP